MNGPPYLARLWVCIVVLFLLTGFLSVPQTVRAEGFFSEFGNVARFVYCSFSEWIGLSSCTDVQVPPAQTSEENQTAPQASDINLQDDGMGAESESSDEPAQASPEIVREVTEVVRETPVYTTQVIERLIEPRYLTITQSGSESLEERIDLLTRRLDHLVDGPLADDDTGVSEETFDDTLEDYLLLTGGELSGTLTAPALGIGTTSPADVFALSGAAYLSQIAAPAVTANRLYNVSGDLYWAGSLIGGGSVGTWDTDGTHVYRTSGNVGIGTSNPGALLELSGNSPVQIFNHNDTQLWSVGYSGAGLFRIRDNTAGVNALVIENGTSAESLYIKSSGYIGVGSSSPYAKLSVTNTGSGPSFLVEDSTSPDATPFVISASGNVGVGTINPASKLSFGAQDTAANTIGNKFALYELATGNALRGLGYVNVNGTRGIGVWTISTDTAPSLSNTSMFIEDGGKIGIGTSTPQAVLDVNVSGVNDVFRFSRDAGTASLTLAFPSNQPTFTANGDIVFKDASAEIFRADASSNGLALGYADAPTSGLSVLGSVGIGTSTPSQKLTVDSGTVDVVSEFISSDSTAMIRVADNSGADARFGLYDGKVKLSYGSITNSHFAIDSAGNIGIGTTDPLYKLDIVGGNLAVRSGGTIVLSENADSGGEAQISAVANGTGGDLAFYTETSGTVTEKVRIDSDGNVGIGTTSPSGKLHVVASSGIGIYAEVSNNYLLYGKNTASSDKQWGLIMTGNDLAIREAGSASHLTVQSGGNVGIGTTSPARKLHLNVDAGISVARIDGDAGQYRGIEIATNNSLRWLLAGANTTAESGSNAGSDFQLVNYDDSGSFISRPLTILRNSGNMGLGTTSPYAKLSIANTSSGPSFLVEDSTSPDATPFVIDAGGKVGIGIGSPGAKLEVFDSGTSPKIRLRDSNVSNGVAIELLKGTGTGGFGTSNTYGFQLGYNLDGTNNFTISSNNNGGASNMALAIARDSGNVGIGTTSPRGKLEVAEAADSTFYTSHPAGSTLALNFANAADEVINSRLVAYTHQFYVSGSTPAAGSAAMILDQFGSLGVGTSSPYAKLSITNTGSGPSFLVEDAASPDSSPFVIDADGKVGIGTASPSEKFEVINSGGTRVKIYDTSSFAVLRLESNDTTALDFGRPFGFNLWGAGLKGAGSNFTIWDAQNADAERFVIVNGTGNVGIGTTSPYAKLSVAGTTVAENFVATGTAATSTVTNLITNGTFIHNGNNGAQPFYLSRFGLLNEALKIDIADTRIVFTSIQDETIDTSGSFRFDMDNGASDAEFSVRYGSTDKLMLKGSSGNLGVGTSSPWRKLSVTGTVGFDGLTGATGAGSLCLSSNKEVVYNAGSDACLPSLRDTKHFINPLAFNALETISLLEPVSFVYNDSDGRLRYGFIAEDTREVDAQLATYNAEGELSGIDDRSIIAVLVKAVQELNGKMAAAAGGAASAVGDALVATFDRIFAREIEAVNIRVKDVTAEKFCLGTTCITEAEFKKLLENADVAPHVDEEEDGNDGGADGDGAGDDGNGGSDGQQNDGANSNNDPANKTDDTEGEPQDSQANKEKKGEAGDSNAPDDGEGAGEPAGTAGEDGGDMPPAGGENNAEDDEKDANEQQEDSSGEGSEEKKDDPAAKNPGDGSGDGSSGENETSQPTAKPSEPASTEGDASTATP